MPRLVKGDHAVETSVPREVVTLKAQGYREQKALTKRVRKADASRAGVGKPAEPAADSPAN